MGGAGLSGHSLSRKGEFRYSRRISSMGCWNSRQACSRELGDCVTCHAPHTGDVEETRQSGWDGQLLS